MSKRTSDIGKLYDTCQDSKHLDKLVTEAYRQLEFDIKTGWSLPIQVVVDPVNLLHEAEVEYILKNLNTRGVVAKVPKTKFDSKKLILIVEELL